MVLSPPGFLKFFILFLTLSDFVKKNIHFRDYQNKSEKIRKNQKQIRQIQNPHQTKSETFRNNIRQIQNHLFGK